MTSDAQRTRREPFALGLEVCAKQPPRILRGKRFGLVMNQASIDGAFRTADDVLDDAMPGQLAALFGPQHGLWSEQQDNMIETTHAIDRVRGIPIHSLYADVRKPTPEMLHGLDALVIDLQDVGTRIYTYVWTLSHCLEAAAERGIPVVVLDRPNPLGCQIVEGPRLDLAFASFVGRASIPMRHGLTMAELARYLNESMQIGADVEYVPMRGYLRGDFWFDLGRLWIPPSPNLPRLEGVLVYPGQVLLEGANLSEGRGTTTPFELFGAPWLEPDALLEALDELGEDLQEGVVARPYRFEPTFQKHAGKSCGGLFLHPTDASALRSYRLTAALLGSVRKLYPDTFAWLEPPYEYEHEKLPIDILSGATALREAVDAGLTRESLDAICALDQAAWNAETTAARIYC